MSTKIVNILCEGATEEQFVVKVLKPHLSGFNVITKPRLLLTSRKQQAAGGMISYAQAKGDLERWMKELSTVRGAEHYFTTMFDFYALPNDFPGFDDAKKISDAYSKVKRIEDEFCADISSSHFIPYIQLHEFEALLFCDIEKLIGYYPQCKKDIQGLNSVLKAYQGNPELINSSFNTAPSRRIIAAIEGKRLYKYRKPSSGASVTSAIGMANLKVKCQHFRMWVERLEKL